MPIQLEIEVLLEKYEILNSHQVVNVYSNLADSEIIDGTILSFNFDHDRHECFVRLPSPYRPNERFFIGNQRQLAQNYPSVVGTPSFEYRFAADNPRAGL